jgi:foldase protein PrsA
MRLAGLGLLGIIVAGLVTAALGGRGDDLPPDAVARVAGSVVTKAEFDREAARTPIEAGMGGRAFPSAPYDPPDYSACVAAKEKEHPTPAGGEKTSGETLKSECEDEFEGLMPTVMESLIEAEWIRQEAKARGIEVSQTKVEGAVDDFLERQGASQKETYRAFLSASGMTREELVAHIRVEMLEDALSEKVTAGTSKVTDREIQRNYEMNGRRFEQPERRDLNLVLTRTKAQADDARAELEGGASWREIARSHSIDASSRALGGKILGVTKGEHEAELAQAAFSAKKGVLEGPVETQFGWYVFEVTRIRAAGAQTSGLAKRRIRRRLRAEREQVALDDFNAQLKEIYRARTVCANGFKVALCGNAS